ncbi:hypothetical protein C5E43_14450 [Nocardia cyriacigeorgica]|nr:hypothetical protein C5B73_11345 [Nocardia cyriacigeorgica]PPJ09540.1 hypothetical protein C5E43_14450 [Nocardia cyriacigeorgica]
MIATPGSVVPGSRRRSPDSRTGITSARRGPGFDLRSESGTVPGCGDPAARRTEVGHRARAVVAGRPEPPS